MSVLGVSFQRVLCPGGSLSGGSLSGSSLFGRRSLPTVNRMTDAGRNITLLQTSFSGGNYDNHKQSCQVIRYQKVIPRLISVPEVKLLLGLHTVEARQKFFTFTLVLHNVHSYSSFSG